MRFVAKFEAGPCAGETRQMVDRYPYVVLSYYKRPNEPIRWAKYVYVCDLDAGSCRYTFSGEGEWGKDEPGESEAKGGLASPA